MTTKKDRPRRPYKARESKAIPAMPPPDTSIDAVNKLANDIGISYGKYMKLVMEAEAAGRRKRGLH